MSNPITFTPEELSLISDREFFRAKAVITRKVRGVLDAVYAGLKEEVKQVTLVAPEGFDSEKFQFVKGEHLEDYPYQYLDFPKHFVGNEKFTFRSLFWWGHHFVFALILEGRGLRRYKQNLVNRFHQVAGRELSLCLGPSLWDWKQGEGYTLSLTHERKSEVGAVLSNRPFFKLARFVSPDDPEVRDGRVPEIARQTFRDLLPVITA